MLKTLALQSKQLVVDFGQDISELTHLSKDEFSHAFVIVYYHLTMCFRTIIKDSADYINGFVGRCEVSTNRTLTAIKMFLQEDIVIYLKRAPVPSTFTEFKALSKDDWWRLMPIITFAFLVFACLLMAIVSLFGTDDCTKWRRVAQEQRKELTLQKDYYETELKRLKRQIIKEAPAKVKAVAPKKEKDCLKEATNKADDKFTTPTKIKKEAKKEPVTGSPKNAPPQKQKKNNIYKAAAGNKK